MAVCCSDEVGDLSPPMLGAPPARARIAVTPVGSGQPIATRPRVIAATFATSTASGRRLVPAAISTPALPDLIVTPPLRERREDILPIFHAALGVKTPLTAELAETLVLHDWPFNVRELVKLATD